MPRFSLLGGAYKSASLIASAQRSINLYPEKVPEETKEGVQAVHLLRPGLRFLSAPPTQGRGRCLYAATDGSVYAVVDQSIYYIDANFTWTLLGALPTQAATPVSMADNGSNVVIVDGSANGNVIQLSNRALTQIGDPNFLGADRTDYVDTFLVFNQSGTPNWYSSLSNSVVFNALDFGTKTSFPDSIQTIIAVQREVWLLGRYKSEVAYNAGSAGFPFQTVPGNIVEHGCAAKYSAAKQDEKIYWLSQSPEGDRMVLQNDGRAAKRISTHAIEAEFKTYPLISDAIGGCFQISGHGFYVLHFPLADKTWVYDEATKEWHEHRWCDTNGVLHRSRAAFYAFAYGTNLALDWATGALYAQDPAIYVDQISASQSAPIVWVRSLPHMLGDRFERVSFNTLIADCEVGTGFGTQDTLRFTSPWGLGFSPGFGPKTAIEPPLISLRWSDDRGYSFGNMVLQNLGAQGEYNTTVTWWNTGMARDRVWELSGSTSQKFSLLGVFNPDAEDHET